MICKKCGARIPEGARSCPRCGLAAARRTSSSPNSRSGKKAASRSANRKLIPALVVGAVTVLAVAICLAMFSGSDEKPAYARVLDRYFAALSGRDAEGYASTRPGAYIAYLTREDGGSYLNRDLYINELTETIDARMNGYAAVCGSNLRIKYSISQALDMSPYIDRINETLTNWYDFPADSVASAVLVTGGYTVRGNSASQEFPIEETLLLEIDGEWFFSPDIGQSWRN